MRRLLTIERTKAVSQRWNQCRKKNTHTQCVYMRCNLPWLWLSCVINDIRPSWTARHAKDTLSANLILRFGGHVFKKPCVSTIRHCFYTPATKRKISIWTVSEKLKAHRKNMPISKEMFAHRQWTNGEWCCTFHPNNRQPNKLCSLRINFMLNKWI